MMTAKGKILCCLLFWLWVPGAAVLAGTIRTTPAPADADAVMAVLTRLEARMADIHSVQSDFIQKKNLAVFNQVLEISGSVCLEKPDRLAWHVRKPLRYSLVIKDGTVRNWFEDTDDVQEISLSNNFVFKTVIKQMRQWFSGTYTTLVSEYRVMLIGRDPVRLRFIPRENTMAAGVIGSVTVAFEKDERYIRRITILEKSGDSSDLMFVNTRLNAPLDAAAWEVKPGGK